MLNIRVVELRWLHLPLKLPGTYGFVFSSCLFILRWTGKLLVQMSGSTSHWTGHCLSLTYVSADIYSGMCCFSNTVFRHTGERIRSLQISGFNNWTGQSVRVQQWSEHCFWKCELSPTLDRKMLFSVYGSSKNHTERDIYIYIYIYIYMVIQE
jgi:hypothetical protein